MCTGVTLPVWWPIGGRKLLDSATKSDAPPYDAPPDDAPPDDAPPDDAPPEDAPPDNAASYQLRLGAPMG